MTAPQGVKKPWAWYWQPAYSTASLYGNMLMMARRAIKAGGVIKGFLWYQGEGETADHLNVILYDCRVHRLFQSLREDLGIPNLPIVFVKLGPDPGWWPFWSSIQAWQQAIADAHPPGIAMADASDLHSLPAGQAVHLDTPSQVTLGTRMADAMYQLQSNP